MRLRKITINENIYLYKIQGEVNPVTKNSVLSIKIFLNDYKLTPLLLNFHTWDDPIIGFPLNHGFPLFNSFTDTEEKVNLNRPKYIRECVLYGEKKGWNGKNKLEPLDGLKMLKDLGYDISVLLPKIE
ncbi:hypothetical protein L1276_004017 [Flavobacterium sp. HSC-32F16]|uniref:hypothetical protein n=1 Tax=Flavobacterium sp. HSC-32F16 TaxID=2910964 RepID=UPI0020A43F76|nr:hypothetical protein [Flavobacterium sp. HSC-32F16]MCP2028846.1 hypothetical protein [Flavobacterium sp. HSC-32F16]